MSLPCCFRRTPAFCAPCCIGPQRRMRVIICTAPSCVCHASCCAERHAEVHGVLHLVLPFLCWPSAGPQKRRRVISFIRIKCCAALMPIRVCCCCCCHRCIPSCCAAVTSEAYEGDQLRQLVAALCPTIYGHELVKAGLLLSLFGGVRKHGSSNNRVRAAAWCAACYKQV
jgi:hypothetical protein